MLLAIGIASVAAISAFRVHYWWYWLDIGTFPWIPQLFQDRPHGSVYAALGGACLFIILGRKLFSGNVPTSPVQTILLLVITLFWLSTEWTQAKIWQKEYYRVRQLQSFLSFLMGCILIGAVWVLWLLARRKPTWHRSLAFTWALTVYFWSVWGTSPTTLEGID